LGIRGVFYTVGERDKQFGGQKLSAKRKEFVFSESYIRMTRMLGIVSIVAGIFVAMHELHLL